MAAETLTSGSSYSVTLDYDDSITVTGTATVIATGPVTSVNTANSGTTTYGPYARGASVRIIAGGSVTYTLNRVDGGDGVVRYSMEQNPSLSGDAAGAVRRGSNNIQGGYKLKRMAAALAGAGTQRVNMAFGCTSVVAGTGSDDTNPVQYVQSSVLQWRTKGVSAAASRILNASLGGQVGYGVESFGGQPTFFTYQGGPFIGGAYGAFGPGGFLVALASSTQGFTFIAQGSVARIYGSASAVGVVPRYAINGGSVQTSAAATSNPQPLGTQHWHTYDITGLVAGDSVQILGPTSGTMTYFFVDPNNLSTPGVTLHRVAVPGRAGMQVDASYLDGTDVSPPGSWITQGANYRLLQAQSVSTRLGVNGGVIQMSDINDLKMFANTAEGYSYGITLEGHKRHLTNFINYNDSIGQDTLIVTGPIVNPVTVAGFGCPYTQSDLIDAFGDVCANSKTGALLDLTNDWDGGYAAEQLSGFKPDGIHPGSLGSSYYGGARIARALLNLVSA